MRFDLFTLTLMTALVVFTCGIMFLVETLLRRDHGAGRVWALSFLGGMLATLCYLVWTVTPQPWIAIAIGNAAVVGSVGLLWLGCRAYNGLPGVLPGCVVAAVAVLTALAVLLEGPAGGDWAGALAMFLATAVFAALGARESRLGNMGRAVSSLGLTIVLALAAAFYFARSVVAVVDGTDGVFFGTWLGSVATGSLTVVMTIVAVMTVSTLRAGTLAGEERGGGLSIFSDGVLSDESFRRAVSEVVAIAHDRSELVAVVALSIEDMAQIRSAFGKTEQEQLAADWRAGVRRSAPTFSFTGGGPTTVMLCFPTSSVADARLRASLVHRQVLDDFAEMRRAVIPMMGVGVALTSSLGYDADTLVDGAQQAAKTSASSSDTSVVFADVL